VPFVEDEHTVFLKAIIPSRRATSPSSAARSVGGGKRERTRYSRYSKATFRKERRLNIRLLNKDPAVQPSLRNPPLSGDR
jgi:hypothetical protein